MQGFPTGGSRLLVKTCPDREELPQRNLSLSGIYRSKTLKESGALLRFSPVSHDKRQVHLHTQKEKKKKKFGKKRGTQIKRRTGKTRSGFSPKWHSFLVSSLATREKKIARTQRQAGNGGAGFNKARSKVTQGGGINRRTHCA